MFSSLKGSIPGMPSPRTLAASLLATALVALPGCLGGGDDERRARPPRPPRARRRRCTRVRTSRPPRAGGLDERAAPRRGRADAAGLGGAAAPPADLAEHPAPGPVRPGGGGGRALPAGAERPVGLPAHRLGGPRAALARPRRVGAGGEARGALAARSRGRVGRLERARQPRVLERHARAVLRRLRDRGARPRGRARRRCGDRRAEHDEGPAGVARGPAPALPRARLPGRVPVVPREPRGG